jgi:hypothetical protein
LTDSDRGLLKVEGAVYSLPDRRHLAMEEAAPPAKAGCGEAG